MLVKVLYRGLLRSSIVQYREVELWRLLKCPFSMLSTSRKATSQAAATLILALIFQVTSLGPNLEIKAPAFGEQHKIAHQVMK
jgi:hypothetical protein